MIDRLLVSENGSFGRFGKPSEPSALEGSRFGRLLRDSRFQLRNSENDTNLLELLQQSIQFKFCCQAPDSCSCFSTGNLVFARMNLKPGF